MDATLKELLAPFKDTYYKVADQNPKNKFSNASLGKTLTADTWHVYPEGNVNGGFVVAKGHPLFYHHLWGSPVPVVYFEIEVNSPKPPIQRCAFTHWAEKITKARQLEAESPEFSQELLEFLATKDKATIVREYAVELLDLQNHALIHCIATTDPSANVCGRAIRRFPTGLYKDFLRDVLLNPNAKYNSGAMRVYALEKLDPAIDHQLIAEVAEKGGEDWIRVRATEKVDPDIYPDLLLRLSYEKITVGDIAYAAMKKLHPIKHRARLIEIIQNEPSNLFNQHKIVRAAQLLIKGLQA